MTLPAVQGGSPTGFSDHMTRGFKILAGCVLALLLVELSTRLILPPGNWTPEQGLAPSAYWLGQNDIILTKPNLDTWTCANLSPWTKLRTDHRGFRIPNLVRNPTPAGEKILVLGASNTWGMGVAAEKTWPFVFERYLKEKGDGIEVMNAAQVGYTLPHMFLRTQQLVDDIDVDRVFIAVPSSGLYMFGLGSSADPWHFVNFHPWQVTTLPLEYPFQDLPALEQVGQFVLRADRSFAGTFVDVLRTKSALGHRIWVKSALRLRRFDVVRGEKVIDLERLKKSAAQLGQRFCDLEDNLASRGIGLHLVFFPAEWEDLGLANNDTEQAILAAFQQVARVGLRRFPRADLRADPRYRIALDSQPGTDVLIDGRHLSARGHEKVAQALARWYIDKNIGKR